MFGNSEFWKLLAETSQERVSKQDSPDLTEEDRAELDRVRKFSFLAKKEVGRKDLAKKEVGRKEI